jgi:PAS domain S-box-containing protein
VSAKATSAAAKSLAAENAQLRRELDALKSRLRPNAAARMPREVIPEWDGHFAELLPDAAYVHRDDGTILAVNSAGVKQFGATSAAEIIGRNNFDFIHRDHHANTRDHVARVRSQLDRATFLRRRRLRLDGSGYPAEISAMRARYGDQDVQFVIVRDLSERMEADTALSQARTLLADAFDSVSDGLAIFDEGERLVRTNSQFLRGHPKRDYVLEPGIPFEEFIRRAMTSDRQDRVPGTVEEEVQKRLQWFRHAGAPNEFTDGKRWFLVSHRRTPAGYTVVLNTDITARKKAEQEVTESAERLRVLFDSSPDAIYVHKGGTILLANPAAIRLFGAKSTDDLVGRSVADTFLPEERESIQQRLASAHARAAPRTADGGQEEQRRARLDGSELWVDVTIAPMKWDGEVSTVVFARDATMRKKMHAAYELQQAILNEAIESINEGLWIFDGDHRLVAANRRLAAMMQYTDDLLTPGTPFEKIMRFAIERGDFGGGDREQLLMERLRTTKATEPFMFERAAPGGATLEVRYAPMQGGGFVCTIADITARKQFETALAELNEKLMAQTTELQRSNEELEQFAYVASHDLQEPLRSIGSYCQLLQRRYKGKLDKDADEFIDFAVEGAKRMQVLINDLLKYSRVGTRGKAFEPTDCNAVFKDAIANLRQAIDEAGATVTADPLPSISGDSVQLGQLFQNLIGNAVKFRGEEPPKVHVSARDEGAETVFSVRDNGIGIDARHADRIFQIFQRLHERGKYPGTGIGLAVCKKIVARHGGRIWVESTPGEGSTFHFTLAPKGDPQSESGQ